MKTEIKLSIQPQPNDETCGPTCLHALYQHYGVKDTSLPKLISEIHRLDGGGTLAEILANHALKRGFDATIYTYHMQMFDPTWFAADGAMHDREDLAGRLQKQLEGKIARRASTGSRGSGGPGENEKWGERASDKRLKTSTAAFKEFLALGGQLRFEDLTPALLVSHISKGVPIIAGLSSTFLYRHARENAGQHATAFDDIMGEPQGHFVMLVGWDPRNREILVADPLDPNPPFHTAKYRLNIDRLINTILLGIVTYDANLLVISPKGGVKPPIRRKPVPRKPVPRKKKTKK